MSGTNNKTIIKNASALLVAQPVTWALTLALTIVLPRYLGAEAAGQLGVAASLWAIAGIFISFGMDTFLAKEIARYPERAGELLATSLILRGLFYLVSCGLVSLYIYLAGFSGQMIALVFITGLAQIFWRVDSALEAVQQGFETMQYISIATVISKALTTALGLGVVFLRLDIYAAASIGVITSLATLLLQLFFLLRHHRLSLRPRLGLLPFIFKSSTPFLFSAIGIGLYKQIDVQVIAAFAGTKTVGWYNSALTLYATLFFVPTTLSTVVFPALSRSFIHNPGASKQILDKVFNLVCFISIPISLGLFVIAQPLVLLLYGPDFAPAGGVLMLMSLVVLFSHQNVLVGRYLYTIERQGTWAMVLFASAVATLPLDLLFIPWCLRLFGNGALGGAISYFITELTMFIVGIRLIPSGVLGWSNLGVGARALLAGLLMVAAIWWCREMFIAIPVAIGAAVYLAAALALRVVPLDDLRTLVNVLLGFVNRRRRRSAPRVSAEGA